MTRPLPERYKNLPPEISMDYRMTEENLWVFWVKTPEDVSPPIVHGFSLASPGLKGFQELKKAEHGKLLFALTLSQLREITQELNVAKSSLLSKLPAWLGGHENYLVVEEENGEFKTTITEASSEEECFVQILSKTPTANILWVVPITPLLKLKEELEKILAEESYSNIYFDRRPEMLGHPKDWFEYMQRPHSYPKAKKAQEYFKAHPEKWELARQACLEDLKKGKGPI